jgi:hypothetical protein
MIVGARGKLSGARWEIVRPRTLLETVRGGRYSPNMCSPIASTAAHQVRLTEEG